MANLSLTAVCNRSCDFCFAGGVMTAPADARYMPRGIVDAAFDFLERSSIREARLLGGEPTLHPRFDAIVTGALARGLDVLVFSGGCIPERVLDCLASTPEGRVTVLVNTIRPDEARPAERTRQNAVLKRLGRRAMLGVTIDRPGVGLGFLLDLIERCDLVPAVRLGIAHPAPGGGNTFLHPRHYAEVGRRAAEFGFEAGARGVGVAFDCGWVPCMFPEGALDALGLAAGDVGRRCSPILDLLPDGRVVACYPLAAHAAEPLSGDAREARARFVARQKADRVFTLFKTCGACAWRARGECTGGCLAASLRQTRPRPRAVELAVGA